MARRDSKKGAEIGARIAEARAEAGGMTQRELGELIGVSERSIHAYETGEVIPYRQLRDLERALGKDAAWLLHGEEAYDARDKQFDEILKRLEAVEGALRALQASLPSDRQS